MWCYKGFVNMTAGDGCIVKEWSLLILLKVTSQTLRIPYYQTAKQSLLIKEHVFRTTLGSRGVLYPVVLRANLQSNIGAGAHP